MVEDGYFEPLHVEAKGFGLGTQCHEIAHALDEMTYPRVRWLCPKVNLWTVPDCWLVAPICATARSVEGQPAASDTTRAFGPKPPRPKPPAF
jgi:hypothetical protein